MLSDGKPAIPQLDRGRKVHFRQFDSFEQACEFMENAAKEANQMLASRQKEITWGSYWVRFEPTEQLIIFGHVYTMRELVDGERKAGADEDELFTIMQTVKNAHDRGFLFGDAYSVWCPEGELGDTHRSTVWPITEEQFKEAKTYQWIPAAMPGVHSWLRRAYDEFRHHIAGLSRG